MKHAPRSPPRSAGATRAPSTVGQCRAWPRRQYSNGAHAAARELCGDAVEDEVLGTLAPATAAKVASRRQKVRAIHERNGDAEVHQMGDKSLGVCFVLALVDAAGSSPRSRRTRRRRSAGGCRRHLAPPPGHRIVNHGGRGGAYADVKHLKDRHGAARVRPLHWPGTRGTPPVVIAGDTFGVAFASTTDTSTGAGRSPRARVEEEFLERLRGELSDESSPLIQEIDSVKPPADRACGRPITCSRRRSQRPAPSRHARARAPPSVRRGEPAARAPGDVTAPRRRSAARAAACG